MSEGSQQGGQAGAESGQPYNQGYAGDIYTVVDDGPNYGGGGGGGVGGGGGGEGFGGGGGDKYYGYNNATIAIQPTTVSLFNTMATIFYYFYQSILTKISHSKYLWLQVVNEVR